MSGTRKLFTTPVKSDSSHIRKLLILVELLEPFPPAPHG